MASKDLGGMSTEEAFHPSYDDDGNGDEGCSGDGSDS